MPLLHLGVKREWYVYRNIISNDYGRHNNHYCLNYQRIIVILSLCTGYRVLLSGAPVDCYKRQRHKTTFFGIFESLQINKCKTF
jgi:hypothetical protein